MPRFILFYLFIVKKQHENQRLKEKTLNICQKQNTQKNKIQEICTMIKSGIIR